MVKHKRSKINNIKQKLFFNSHIFTAFLFRSARFFRAVRTTKNCKMFIEAKILSKLKYLFIKQ